MEKHNRIYTQIRCIFFTHSQKMFPKDHFRLLACQYILKYHKHSKLFYTQKRIMWPRITWNVFYKTWLLTGQVISYAIHNFRMTIIATGTEEHSVGSSFTVLHFMNDPGYLRRRKEDMFSFPFICLSVCLFVHLSVNTLIQNVLHGFSWNFYQAFLIIKGRASSIVGDLV